MEILLKVRENPGMTKTALANVPVGPFHEAPNERTGLQRINHLVKIGLIETRTGGTQWNATELYLSPTGERVAEHIAAINAEMKALYESLPEDDDSEDDTSSEDDGE